MIRPVSTGIYGSIEVRDLSRAAWDPEMPWFGCVDLWPLYPNNEYASFGCLFGVRNWPGWQPVAAGRGLPDDVSTAVRTEYEKCARLDDAIHGSTWVSWPELRDLDVTVTPPAPHQEMTRLDVLGPGTGWEHVFAVMRTLAQRFGEDGVRLVVWFD